eukprot:gene44820-biopygen30831
MTDILSRPSARPSRSRTWLWALAAALLAVAMGFGTTVVRIGSVHDVREQKFSPQAFGEKQFPDIKANVEKRAVDALALAGAIATDKKAAAGKYGVATSIGPVFPVSFTGVVGERKSNFNIVKVDGLPPE